MSGVPLSWRPPEPSEWVSKLDSLGPSAGGRRLLVPLDADDLIAAASSSTGLTDFGPDGWREHFDLLVRALDESPLHVVGRLLARNELLRTLRNRLQITSYLRANPEQAAADIVAPIFVVGTARSGTSITHELLSCDPSNRMPTTWMALHPVEAATGGDPAQSQMRRIGDDEVTLWHDIIPAYAGMHLNGGDLPTECIFLTMNEFLSDQWAGNNEVPTYLHHLIAADHRPAFETHRRVLQVLNSCTTGDRWALKAPSHLSTLDALFAVYPDARVLMLHRDPLETIPSTLSLMSTTKRMRVNDVDVAAMAATVPMGYEYLLRSMLERRASGELPDRQFHDLRFPDLMAHPVEAIRGAYDNFGIDLPDRVAERMRRYVEAKPRGAHGGHRYDLADFGLDRATERERFGWYTDRFDLARP